MSLFFVSLLIFLFLSLPPPVQILVGVEESRPIEFLRASAIETSDLIPLPSGNKGKGGAEAEVDENTGRGGAEAEVNAQAEAEVDAEAKKPEISYAPTVEHLSAYQVPPMLDCQFDVPGSC